MAGAAAHLGGPKLRALILLGCGAVVLAAQKALAQRLHVGVDVLLLLPPPRVQHAAARRRRRRRLCLARLRLSLELLQPLLKLYGLHRVLAGAVIGGAAKHVEPWLRHLRGAAGILLCRLRLRPAAHAALAFELDCLDAVLALPGHRGAVLHADRPQWVRQRMSVACCTSRCCAPLVLLNAYWLHLHLLFNASCWNDEA